MRPRVLLLATKDTFAYTVADPDHPGIATGADLLATIPSRHHTADVTVEDVPTEPSWDTTPATMLTLARRARTAILDDHFDGVVIAHGADTLEDTAYLTDLTAGPAADQGTIVLTTAMRHLDELSTDGPRNLATAITAAAEPSLRATGALVCVNDHLHAARWVTQTDATSTAGFTSHPYPPVARLVAGRIQHLIAPPPRPPRTDGQPELDVALIRTYPGIDPTLLTTAADAGARGVVLEGTGQANIPVTLFTAIHDLTEWDIPVVLTSHCHTGDLPIADLPAPTALATKVGAIWGRGLSPTKARYALMVALATGGVTAVRHWFARL